MKSAFEAWDEDDSGGIDVGNLKEALLSEKEDDGRAMTEGEIERVMGAFLGRREFGKKGRGGAGYGRGTGEVFKYRDFVGVVGGGGRMSESDER